MAPIAISRVASSYRSSLTWPGRRVARMKLVWPTGDHSRCPWPVPMFWRAAESCTWEKRAEEKIKKKNWNPFKYNYIILG